MTDYTLPPLPEHNGWENELGKPYWVAAVVLRHGQQCAEAGRAPLLQMICELNDSLGVIDFCQVKPLMDGLQARIAELNGQIERQAAVLRQQREQIAELEADAKRGRFCYAEAAWHRDDGRTYLAIRVPDGSDLSCLALRRDALDAAMKESGDA